MSSQPAGDNPSPTEEALAILRKVNARRRRRRLTWLRIAQMMGDE